jgi:predicted HTH transcriptional regulator
MAHLVNAYQSQSLLENKMTPLEQVSKAIAEHGRPTWVAYIPSHIVKQVPYADLLVLLDNAEQTRRQDKHKLTMAWLLENTHKTITAKDLAEQMDVTAPTARRFIQDNPFYFRTNGRGTWEIRNPKEDRK